MERTLPTTRPEGCPFDPPARLAELRETAPVTRLLYPDGHEGWLVTSHEPARRVLSDPRFSTRPEIRHIPVPGMPVVTEPPPPGMFSAMDDPGHARYRSLLAGQFTVRRMRRLTERVEQVTAECLDEMERNGSPADLVTALARPVPAHMICELLGVPYEERGDFTEAMGKMVGLGVDPEEFAAAYGGMVARVSELVAAKRKAPTDDMLSGLTEGDLTDEELVNIGFTLLGAGLDTTTNMIGLGTFALLTHPEQWAAVRDEPELAKSAVEELLRYVDIIPILVRTALEDVELDGHVIAAGESVTASIGASNRDPARFEDPDTLDVRRQASGHVAFGHGIHQCLGQQLARVELQVAIPALARRFPDLRLDVPAEKVPTRADMSIYGVHSLPVAWGTGRSA